MFDGFRYRHITAAIAAQCGAATQILVVGNPTLARLLAGTRAGGASPEAIVLWGDPGEIAQIAAIAQALASGGELMWFCTLPPAVPAGRLLGAGLSEIGQRMVGRQLLTFATKLREAPRDGMSLAER